jgi:hypothetical protein
VPTTKVFSEDDEVDELLPQPAAKRDTAATDAANTAKYFFFIVKPS